MSRLPNILITGTPGTGKSTLSSEISELTSLEWLNVGQIAKDNNFYEEYDENLECHVLDEDKLIEELEEKMREGGKIVDYHGCDLFPEEWFDIVFVLTTDNTILYDRLARRGYSGKKLENNLQCEIFQVLLEEAKKAYKENIVYKLESNTPDDMLSNIEQICEWIECYKRQHSNG
ncbi:hypothetical protein TNIN_248351 [Trichonephila inaurata madagascariensis]|uniref:Adenylate kinase isoenzyme 6 homolog n=1 Tax=Trichonephila inaurata madagascariensis TaxID=2747483 RepID=A0A8X6XWU3_9ARAC|nr:hypothetical protein TNIN_248351 [Trichonephila inaurata madagascariensis]